MGSSRPPEIIGDVNAGTAARIDWNLILDSHGGPNKVGNACDAPMVSDGERLNGHPQFYAIGHFSKYISPGSKRLQSSVSEMRSYTGAGAARPYGTCDASDGLQATSFLHRGGPSCLCNSCQEVHRHGLPWYTRAWCRLGLQMWM